MQVADFICFEGMGLIAVAAGSDGYGRPRLSGIAGVIGLLGFGTYSVLVVAADA